MINRKKVVEREKNGFTLVELLAVIVILAIILVIAVPKVMSVIEDAKKATLESTAKMIASQAEKQNVQNTVLGKEEKIICKSVAKINEIDYASCDITFDNNTAKVTIEGSGKFEGLYVCDGTKTESVATTEECTASGGTINTGVSFLEGLLKDEETLQNGLVQTEATYTNADSDEITKDAGLRYVGAMSDVKNKVYYNCEDTDTAGVAYGKDNYDYASSCEVWRIIGVFDTKSSTSGSAEKRIKLINVSSTFSASWDSSTSDINNGVGINQWGESTLIDGSVYKGADLMQLLNGYYIGKVGAECTYCNGKEQETCSQTCTAESLKNANMKVLTNTAKGMIENAVWDTYGVKRLEDNDTTSNFASNAYLQEKGINAQYTGKICASSIWCNDGVVRTTSWTGLVGLISVSDMLYANGWLYNQEGTELYPWTILPIVDSGSASFVWVALAGYAHSYYACSYRGALPSVYLKSDIQIIDGNGDTEPYILK